MDYALIGIVITLFGFIIVHRLSMWREKQSRRISACNSFRNTVIAVVSRVPHADKHWEKPILDDMPKFVVELGSAVALLKPSLSKTERKQLENEWLNLKSHIENQLPKALSAAEVLYGGGSEMAQKSKIKFHKQAQKLLNLANET
jgi:hypothetical protein